MVIARQPELCEKRKYDLIIVGGGVYGVMLALESVRRALRPLLLERNDYGAATSFNSLRIVHGGLRYLQKLDLRRHVESVQERRWFLAHFPDLARPLPCLMPLYGRGVRRKSIFRVALLLNDILSANRNSGVQRDARLYSGSVIGKAETIEAFPAVSQNGLKGAAIWHDGAIPDTQRVIIESLRWAARYGAEASNYVCVTGLLNESGNVRGVRAVNELSGSELSFHAPVVINAAGPWASGFAQEVLGERPDWFQPSLAWNVLTDKPALSDYALAITPPRIGGPTYFLHPWKGRLFIGTGHAAWSGSIDDPAPSDAQVGQMLDDVNSAIPELSLSSTDVSRVFAGLLPATGLHSAELTTRPVIVDHSKSGGPRGLVSVCGVKFTTARRVAARALDAVFGRRVARPFADMPRPQATTGWRCGSVDLSSEFAVRQYLDSIGRLLVDESATNLDDVILRRTDLWERPDLAMKLAPFIADFFDWPEEKKASELKRLAETIGIPGLCSPAVGTG